MHELTTDDRAGSSCNGSGGEASPIHWIDIAVAVLHRVPLRRVGCGPESSFVGQTEPSGARPMDPCEGRQVEVLVARRRAGAVRGGLWEFPGGKIEAGEPALAAALRELHEETGLEVDGSGARALPIATDFDPRAERERAVRLFGFLIEAPCFAVAEARASAEVRWVPLEELGSLPWPPANRLLLESIARVLGAPRAPAS